MSVGAPLSLTGRFARFGTQAAAGLRLWARLAGAEADIVDDRSDPSLVGPALHQLAARCDLLLGPYSTSLARAAARFAAEADRVVWNHGGSGDDVQAAAPGRLISVLTPASRYAEPFIGHLAAHHPGLALRLVAGQGSFGKQVVTGARATALAHGVALARAGADALFAAGTFEEDVALLGELRPRPRVIGTVAAGVQEFADAVAAPDGILGVAQWQPGAGGPAEARFLAAWEREIGGVPDYPAVQAVAAATIAVRCLSEVGADRLWDAAVSWRGTTLFGAFGIDPVTGAQVRHRMTLVRWSGRRLEPVR